MKLTAIKLARFTAFKELELALSPGVNVLIGANGTGKTHLLKVGYAACDITKTKLGFTEKLLRIFMPHDDGLGRLVHRQKGSSQALVEVVSDEGKLRAKFSNHATRPENATVTGLQSWLRHEVECAFLPVKEMLANAPGFRSLYASREVRFEEVYADIIDRAYRPALRGPVDDRREKLMSWVQGCIEGRVLIEDEEFYLKSRQGKIEFPLLAEGLRKLGLLWLLIQNGTLLDGSFLFWDEPEANLNPSVIRPLVQMLLELQRLGVQIFVATHDYVVLKEFDLARQQDDNVVFHSLYRGSDGDVKASSSADYRKIDPNCILATFSDLYDKEVERAMGRSS